MSANIAKKEPLSTSMKIKIAITAIVPCLILLYPSNEVLTGSIKLFFALTVCAILMFAFEIMGNFAPALLLPVSYVIFGVAPASVAFSPWLVSTPWVAISSFVIIAAAKRIGLLNRLTYKILVMIGGTYKGVLTGLFVVGLLVNLPLVGFGMMPMILIGYSLCLSLNLKGTKEAVGIMLTGCLSGACLGTLYYNPQSIGFLVNLFGAAIPLEMSWFKYFSHNIIFLVYFIILIFVIYKMYKPEKDFQGSEFFKEELKKCGPFTADEKKLTALILFLLLWMVTASWHKLGMEWGFLVAAALMYFPGIRVGTEKDVYNVNLTFVLFMVACFSIGNVATSLGVGQLIAQQILPYVGLRSPVFYLGVVFGLCVLLNFFMTPFAILATLSLPLVEMGLHMGIHPLPICYTIFQGMDAVFFPYEATHWLFVYSFGMIPMAQFLKFSCFKVALAFIFLLVAAVPYWSLMGLL